MQSILGPVFLSLFALVLGAVSARVGVRWLAFRRDQQVRELEMREAQQAARLADPNHDLPAYVDRTDAAAVDAFRRANLEVAQSWGKTF